MHLLERSRAEKALPRVGTRLVGLLYDRTSRDERDSDSNDGGSSYAYGEIYLSGGYKAVKSALYYAPAYDGRSTRRHLSAWYWSADNTLPLVEHFSMLNHVGYAWGPYWAQAGGGAKIDYSVGIDYSIKKFDVILQFIDTKRTSAGAGERGDTKGRAVLSFEMGIPW